MQSRLKIVTVFVTMTAMFAMLPALSAVAAEPLDDGGYTIVAGDETLALTVKGGKPLVSPTAGVEWVFDYDDEGRVLDEFDVVVDGVAYEVEIGEQGDAFVKRDDDFVPTPPAPDVSLALDEPADEDEKDLEVELEEEQEDPDDEEGEDAGHGELVSAVAQCAPNGRDAREAGLPNHGAIVRAVAKGEVLDFTVDGTDHTVTIDTATAEAGAICAALDDALAAGQAAADEAAAEAEGATEDTKGKPDKAEKADGEAPGKSGDAPGKGKKNAED